MARKKSTDRLRGETELTKADLDEVVGGAGHLSDIVITKRLDKASAMLFVAR